MIVSNDEAGHTYSNERASKRPVPSAAEEMIHPGLYPQVTITIIPSLFGSGLRSKTGRGAAR